MCSSIKSCHRIIPRWLIERINNNVTKIPPHKCFFFFFRYLFIHLLINLWSRTNGNIKKKQNSGTCQYLGTCSALRNLLSSLRFIRTRPRRPQLSSPCHPIFPWSRYPRLFTTDNPGGLAWTCATNLLNDLFSRSFSFAISRDHYGNRIKQLYLSLSPKTTIIRTRIMAYDLVDAAFTSIILSLLLDRTAVYPRNSDNCHCCQINCDRMTSCKM